MLNYPDFSSVSSSVSPVEAFSAASLFLSFFTASPSLFSFAALLARTLSHSRPNELNPIALIWMVQHHIQAMLQIRQRDIFPLLALRHVSSRTHYSTGGGPSCPLSNIHRISKIEPR